ncbi:cysteine protease ATG4B isoform X2 [Parasteatoda tepidariorum]|uniref:cysteine protease ATG4B isoform X2 n=1 Tax=Parasteatoda tepidariorum TaxID=114398 RepID=UPI001C71EA53|nr:cysteine protease ATG4B isoform X2 [Parasteatoda tepidariorum]
MEEIYAACIAYEPCLLDYVEFKRVTEPIWLLGKKYNIQTGDDFEKLNKDMQSLLWFTYRKQFLPIGESNLTSDSGWGCMHRCGQMIMAQAMTRRHLGREWNWKPGCSNEAYQRILQKFDDKIESQYSIHKIALKGQTLEKRVGQWFGPNTVVQVLRRLIEEDVENDISIHVAMDNMVIKSEIRKLFRVEKRCSSSQESESSAVLLTIPLRLGLSEITPVYFEKLKAVFTLNQTLGIIGGRTNHASYFIGYAGSELIYLDPHTTQLYKNSGPMDDSSYHCRHPSRMSFSQLDPSIAVCFYLENEEDFNQWCTEAQQALLEPERDAIFEILEEKPPMLPYADVDSYDECCTSLDDKDRLYTSDDEFELLM